MDIKIKTINSMRGIALDSINLAGQGHIGMAIGAAPITYTLLGEKLNIAKSNPRWMNRDRFVLSAGHGSMAQYSIMHFLGLLKVNDLKKHKQYKSKTPAHPEIEATNFVDASTGPLGQGVAMAVGMAISQKYLQNTYNKPKFKLFDHSVYALHGDGCLQEGVALESIQLAGTLKLDSLILIHDFNNVQIDSHSSEVNNIHHIDFFKSQGFSTFEVKKPTPKNIAKAIESAKKSLKPSYIKIHTIIAQGTPSAGKPAGHNGTLDKEETFEFKKSLELNENAKPFVYEEDVYKHCEKLMDKKERSYQKWIKLFDAYKHKHKNLYKELNDVYSKKYKFSIKDLKLDEKNVATRNYIATIMKKLESHKGLIGGSADLAGATKVSFSEDLINGGKNIKYGIREFAMSSINNGIFLHSGIKTIDSTFLAFADYGKAAYRLGAIQNVSNIHVFTHDSYLVGGDGPTHQPIEQIGMLRMIPGFKVIRPCDGSEMKAAFEYALNSQNEQVAIIACRQPIKSYDLIPEKFTPAYKVHGKVRFDVTILASGSEIELAVNTAQYLEKKKIKVQVISVPLLQDLLNNQKLIKELNIDKKPIYVIEASNDPLWYKMAKYNKVDGTFATGYGYSADGEEVYKLKGFEKIKISKKIMKFLDK